MKRFWLVLLSLALVIAFSASAFAELKVSGSFYAAGMYLDKTTLVKDSASSGPSTSFYFQRLRLTTEFIAAPGLSAVATANIMQRAWGATRSTPSGVLDSTPGGTTPLDASAATRAENENIGFDYAYLNWTSPIGLFRIGYISDMAWGTVFNDNEVPSGKVTYTVPVGNWILGVQAVKLNDRSYTAINATTQSDHDTDKYQAFVVYKTKDFAAGVLWAYADEAKGRITTPAILSTRARFHSVQPYIKATFGPLAIQAELDYYAGDALKVESPGALVNQKLNSLAGWIDAVATFGPVYVGGTFAYSQGQGEKNDEVNVYASGGKDWSPTLIMWNADRNYWIGNINGATSGGLGTAKFGTQMVNALFYQVRAGVRPAASLDICASAAFAQADTLNGFANATQAALASTYGFTNNAGYVSKDYGTEIDVTATYKITNNLSYMLGFGYLITGDYFKANNASNSVANDYIVTNKLTLTF